MRGEDSFTRLRGRLGLIAVSRRDSAAYSLHRLQLGGGIAALADEAGSERSSRGLDPGGVLNLIACPEYPVWASWPRAETVW